MHFFTKIAFNVNGSMKEYICNSNDCIVFDEGIKTIPNSILIPTNGSYGVIFKGINKELPEKFGFMVDGQIFYKDDKNDNHEIKDVTMKIIGENGFFTEAQFECKRF